MNKTTCKNKLRSSFSSISKVYSIYGAIFNLCSVNCCRICFPSNFNTFSNRVINCYSLNIGISDWSCSTIGLNSNSMPFCTITSSTPSSSWISYWNIIYGYITNTASCCSGSDFTRIYLLLFGHSKNTSGSIPEWRETEWKFSTIVIAGPWAR